MLLEQRAVAQLLEARQMTMEDHSIQLSNACELGDRAGKQEPPGRDKAKGKGNQPQSGQSRGDREPSMKA